MDNTMLRRALSTVANNHNIAEHIKWSRTKSVDETAQIIRALKNFKPNSISQPLRLQLTKLISNSPFWTTLVETSQAAIAQISANEEKALAIDHDLLGDLEFLSIVDKLDNGAYDANFDEFRQAISRFMRQAHFLFEILGSPFDDDLTCREGAFLAELNAIAKEFGFCCGEAHCLHKKIRCLDGKMCAVPPGGLFYHFDNRCFVCKICFDGVNSYNGSEDVQAYDELYGKYVNMAKSSFTLSANVSNYEKQVRCRLCFRSFHAFCVRCLNPDAGSFQCQQCTIDFGTIEPPPRFRARDLAHCAVTEHIEAQVAELLKGTGVTLLIRPLYLTTTTFKTDPNRLRIMPDFPKEFPCSKKMIVAFVETPDGDFMDLSIYVEEYDHTAAACNRRSIYLAELESPRLLQTSVGRTNVYYVIVSAYLDFMRRAGYVRCHLWIKPPDPGMHYIFWCRRRSDLPYEKRIIFLRNFYKGLLNVAKNVQIVTKVQNLLQFIEEKCSDDMTEFPHYCIKYWQRDLDHDVVNAMRKSGCKDAKEASRIFKDAIYASLDGHADDFLVLTLRDDIMAEDMFPPVCDPDRDVELFANNDNVFTKCRLIFQEACRNMGVEFYDQRRAIYATEKCLQKLLSGKDPLAQ